MQQFCFRVARSALSSSKLSRGNQAYSIQESVDYIYGSIMQNQRSPRACEDCDLSNLAKRVPLEGRVLGLGCPGHRRSSGQKCRHFDDVTASSSTLRCVLSGYPLLKGYRKCTTVPWRATPLVCARDHVSQIRCTVKVNFVSVAKPSKLGLQVNLKFRRMMWVTRRK